MTKYEEICGGGGLPKGARADLDVLVANVYQGNKRIEDDLRLFQELDPIAVGVSEGWRLPRTWKYGFRRVRSRKGGRYSDEVPILVRRRGVEIVSERFVLGARGIRHPRGWSNPRWITVARLRVDGRPVSIVNTHMHAVVQGKSGRVLKNARVAQYEQHMKRLLEIVREEREAGFAPIVTGDLNYRLKGVIRTRRQSWRWGPFKALKRAGLRYRNKGVDGFAYDPDDFEERKRAKRLRSIGSDHPFYLLARLRWRH